MIYRLTSDKFKALKKEMEWKGNGLKRTPVLDEMSEFGIDVTRTMTFNFHPSGYVDVECSMLEPAPTIDSEPTPYIGFGDAVNFLKAGKKVKRKDWGGYWFICDHTNGFTYGKNKEGDLDGTFVFNDIIVAKLKDDGGYAPATPYQADILAEDWLVVE